jgi:hypothetical protein
MKTLFFLPAFCLIAVKSAFAQVTFSQHVAPILYKNCSSCHRPGAIAPFSLLTYNDAYQNRLGMEHATQERHMPPWPPDPAYSRFKNERMLSDADIQTISDWVQQGAPRGDSNLAPPKPVFTSNEVLTAPDLKIRIQPYTIESNEDVYRSFVIPGKILTEQFITAIEFIPDNKEVVHHILIFYDTSGTCKQLDDQDPKPGYASFGGVGTNSAVLISGWVPGATPQIFPKGMGSVVPANADIVLQMHYAPGSIGQKDSSSINIMLSPPGGIRQVVFQPAVNHSSNLVNGPLFIPAGTVKTFYSEITVPFDASIMGVAPHMHLIGQTIKSYAVKPDGDTIQLVRINDWHFHWQGMYNFKKLVYLPQGSIIYGEATYDNTVNNPENPNDPPRDVGLGEMTTDEMMLVYFNYLLYKAGDENLSLEDSVTGIESSLTEAGTRFDLYPNPADDKIHFSISLRRAAPVNLSIYDLSGRLIREVINERTALPGNHHFETGTADLSTGFYICRLQNGDALLTHKLSIIR